MEKETEECKIYKQPNSYHYWSKITLIFLEKNKRVNKKYQSLFNLFSEVLIRWLFFFYLLCLNIVKSYNLPFVTWVKLQTHFKVDIYDLDIYIYQYITSQGVAKIKKIKNIFIYFRIYFHF